MGFIFHRSGTSFKPGLQCDYCKKIISDSHDGLFISGLAGDGFDNLLLVCRNCDREGGYSLRASETLEIPAGLARLCANLGLNIEKLL